MLHKIDNGNSMRSIHSTWDPRRNLYEELSHQRRHPHVVEQRVACRQGTFIHIEYKIKNRIFNNKYYSRWCPAYNINYVCLYICNVQINYLQLLNNFSLSLRIINISLANKQRTFGYDTI